MFYGRTCKWYDLSLSFQWVTRSVPESQLQIPLSSLVDRKFQVSDIGFRYFSPRPSQGLPRRKLYPSVGNLSIQCYGDEATPLDHDDCYLIQITSYHPGALSCDLSQRSTQRAFNITIFKAWLTASEALKYSASTMNGLLLCEQIIGTVERRLNEETNFYAEFERAKDEIKRVNHEMHWKSPANKDASKVLRRIWAVPKTTAKKRLGKVPVTSRPA